MENLSKQMKSGMIGVALRVVAMMLLLSVNFGMLRAQNRPAGMTGNNTREEDKGYVMNKTVNEAGDMITLEAYVTGKTITTTVTIPADIVLVLDASGTMEEHVKKLEYDFKFEAGTKSVYEITNNTYYIQVGDEYHKLKYEKGYNKPYIIIDEVTGDTLANVSYGQGQLTMFNYAVYSQREVSLGYTKGQAMKDAVKNFITLTQQKAQNDGLSHRIAIVKFSESTATTVMGLTTLSESNVQQLKNKVDGISFSGGSPLDMGVQTAAGLLNEASYGTTSGGSVIAFSDGEPNHSGDFIPKYAADAINYAKPLKQKGVKVFSLSYDLNTNTEDVVSHPTSKNQAKNTFMASVSSNYPTASSSSTSTYSFNNNNFDVTLGDRAEGEFFKYADLTSMEKLNEVFTEISKTIGGATISLNATTITQDVLSPYFQLPEGALPESITVKTDTCVTMSANVPNFSGAPTVIYPATGSTVGVSIDDVNVDGVSCKKVSVTGFNYSKHWVGDNSGTPHGLKLIINIPIEPRMGAEPGMQYTNAPGSTIIPNGDGDPLDEFTSPRTWVMGTTWVGAIHQNPGESHIKMIDDTYHIYTKEGLAWFVSIVNGYNGLTGNKDANAVLEADVDMTEGQIQGIEGIHNLVWVPIGGNGKCKNVQTVGGNDFAFTFPKNAVGFSGTFDAQGHIIRGLHNNTDPVGMPEVGLFGKVASGTIKNTFVVGCDFKPATGPTLCTGTEAYFGIIANEMNGGVICNSEAEGNLVTFEETGKMYDGEYAPTQDPTTCYIGGLVGRMTDNAKVHSCMSVASLKGYSMGGCVNKMESSAILQNSYSNVAFQSWKPAVASSLGGLVADNAGTVENCYILDRGIMAAVNAAAGTNKGLLFGQNTTASQYLYIPVEWAVRGDYNLVGQGCNPSVVSSFSQAVTPYFYQHYDTKVENLIGINEYISTKTYYDRLLQSLNAWVEAHQASDCTPWMRTTANGINNDYPVLKLNHDNNCGFKCNAVASDGVAVFYGEINNMMSTRKLMTTYKSDDVICLYKNAYLSQGNNGTTLYINEDVAVKQAADATVNAYVGISLDNSAGYAGINSNHPYYTFDNDNIDWHMFATPLFEAPVGIEYDDETYGFSYTQDDIPHYSFYPESEHDGYFPSTDFNGNDYYNAWDFYCWDEPSQHYINFKRNSLSHWSEAHDVNSLELHQHIHCDENQQSLTLGRGYLLAIADSTFLQSYGKLNNSVVTRTATYNENLSEFCPGYNLIGNPYQSYLDFDKFATNNPTINTYAIIDEDSTRYLYYTATSTTDLHKRFLNMHQGFFIQVDDNTVVTFDTTMRSLTPNAGTHFRGEEQAAYPFLQLNVNEEGGYGDYTTIEFNRPELGGGKKFMALRAGNAQIYTHNGDTNYSTFFATSDFNEIPVRFNTLADGTFTLSWHFSQRDFLQMYLIDNIAGQKIDMLTHNSYMFEAHTTDFTSRFSVVFATTGIEENENADTDTEFAESFAFQMNGNLIVNGMGTCQVFDITGRLLNSTQLTDSQNTLPMPQTAGIYVIQLANNNSVKIQKIVVE